MGVVCESRGANASWSSDKVLASCPFNDAYA